MTRGDPVRGFALTLAALGAAALALALVALGGLRAPWWAAAALVGALLLGAAGIYVVLPARAGQEAVVGTALRASGPPALLLALVALAVLVARLATEGVGAPGLAVLSDRRLVELPAAGAMFFVLFGLAARAWHGGSTRTKNPLAMRLVYAGLIASLPLAASAL